MLRLLQLMKKEAVIVDKQQLINQFKDTQVRTKVLLSGHKLNQHTVMYTQKDLVTKSDSYNKEVKQLVTSDNVIKAIRDYAGNRLGVLNFASATHIGGGVATSGATTQEEALCRVSTLYPTIKKHFKDFYQYNRNNLVDGIYPNRLLYTQNCLLIKDENFASINPIKFDVVTMAAPNLGINSSSDIKQIDHQLMLKMTMILSAFKKNKIDTLLLGAFGCGAFRNSPNTVATYWDVLLHSKYFEHAFNSVIHPIYVKSNDWNKPKSTYKIFASIIK